jgi:hypothetical protein
MGFASTSVSFSERVGSRRAASPNGADGIIVAEVSRRAAKRRLDERRALPGFRSIHRGFDDLNDLQEIASVDGKRRDTVPSSPLVELRYFGGGERPPDLSCRGKPDHHDHQRRLSNGGEVHPLVKVSGGDRLIGHESERDPSDAEPAQDRPRHHAHVGRRVPGGGDDPTPDHRVAHPAPSSLGLALARNSMTISAG